MVRAAASSSFMRFAFPEQRVPGDAASVRPAVGVSGRSTSKHSPPLVKPRLRTIPSRISRAASVCRSSSGRCSSTAPRDAKPTHETLRPGSLNDPPRAVVWAPRRRAAIPDRARTRFFSSRSRRRAHRFERARLTCAGAGTAWTGCGRTKHPASTNAAKKTGFVNSTKIVQAPFGYAAQAPACEMCVLVIPSVSRR